MLTNRLEKLRERMSENNIDVFMLLVEESKNSENCHYISGFRGSSCGLLISEKEAILVTDGRYQTQAKLQTKFNVEIQSDLSVPEYLVRAINASGYVRVGYEGEKISHAMFMKYFAPLRAECVDVSGYIPELRRTKDAQEVEFIRQAGKIGRVAYEKVLSQVYDGMTENEFASKLLSEIKAMGAEKGWAHDDFIVASGERSAMCHAQATEKRIVYGESVTVDYGAMVEGYMSDITRNFCVGEVSKTAREVNDVLLRAHSEAVKVLRAGIRCAEVDGVARKVIGDAGYAKNFVHGLGHGLGLEVHEAPRLSRTSSDILQVGDVVTIEPGIYIEGWGGMRIEDDYLITEDGAECLTQRDNQSVEVV